MLGSEKRWEEMVYVFRYDLAAEKISYYRLEGASPGGSNAQELIFEIPLRREFAEGIVEAAKYLGAGTEVSGTIIVGELKEDAARTHLLYAVILATLERYDKELAHRALIRIGCLNPIFARILFNIAVDRYRESKDNVDWILRVGRSIRILYGLDGG